MGSRRVTSNQRIGQFEEAPAIGFRPHLRCGLMTEKYAVSEAAENLPSIVEGAGDMDTVYLTGEDGQSAVVLMSLREHHRLAHGWRPASKGDFLAAVDKFMAETDLGRLNIEEVYADLRSPVPGQEVEL